MNKKYISTYGYPVKYSVIPTILMYPLIRNINGKL